MADRADFTGTINAKGLTGTGVTEAIIGKHHRAKGGRLMIVASIHVATTSDNVDEGTGQVKYVIDELEVAPPQVEEYIRNLIRSFHYERKLEEDGPQLTDADDLTPKIGDAVAAGGQWAAHPFLPTDAADDNGTCEVCGLGIDAVPHRAFAAKDVVADPFEVPADDDESITDPEEQATLDDELEDATT